MVIRWILHLIMAILDNILDNIKTILRYIVAFVFSKTRITEKMMGNSFIFLIQVEYISGCNECS